jgi:hypothetical protein
MKPRTMGRAGHIARIKERNAKSKGIIRKMIVKRGEVVWTGLIGLRTEDERKALVTTGFIKRWEYLSDQQLLEKGSALWSDQF